MCVWFLPRISLLWKAFVFNSFLPSTWGARQHWALCMVQQVKNWGPEEIASQNFPSDTVCCAWPTLSKGFWGFYLNTKTANSILKCKNQKIIEQFIRRFASGMLTIKLDEVAQDLIYLSTENLPDCTNPLGHSCVAFTTPMVKIFPYLKLKFPLLQMVIFTSCPFTMHILLYHRTMNHLDWKKPCKISKSNC